MIPGFIYFRYFQKQVIVVNNISFLIYFYFCYILFAQILKYVDYVYPGNGWFDGLSGAYLSKIYKVQFAFFWIEKIIEKS